MSKKNDIIKIEVSKYQTYHLVPLGCDYVSLAGDKYCRVLKGKFMKSKRIWTIEQEKVINIIDSRLGNLESDVSILKSDVSELKIAVQANTEGIKQNSIGINKLLNHFKL